MSKSDPDLPLNCPKCGQPVRYEQTFRDVHVYGVTRQLLARGRSFTALFAFNDISAIGATRALSEEGRRIPEDVSVVGFDDIQSAAFQQPGLTTVRQPLRRMGELAAEIVLERIANPKKTVHAKHITVDPELVVRGSTAAISPRAERRR